MARQKSLSFGIFLLVAVQSWCTRGEAPSPQANVQAPHIVGHRGLMMHAPENTIAGFKACIALGLGFELDVRKTSDGKLVCVHDDKLDRTTSGKGNVADFSFGDLRKLDAGAWFDPAFAGQRVPLLDEVLALLKGHGGILVALDIKVPDVEEEVVRIVEKHGVERQVVCIGLAITEKAVRRKLRKASAKIPIAVLAQKADDVPAALKDSSSDWIYIRFVPTAAEATHIHKAGKRVILVGPLVAGKEAENWRRARSAGVDAVLTDYPLECRQTWKKAP